MIGLGPLGFALVAACGPREVIAQRASDPVQGSQTLAAAREVARWLDGVAVEHQGGTVWPAQVEGEPRYGIDLYAGVPGVVLFLLDYHLATGDEAALARARGGLRFMLAELEARGAKLPVGLYTGLAGLGFTFCEAWKVTGDEAYRAGAERCLAHLAERAEAVGEGARWNASTDVISGSAGVGLFLLRAARELHRPDALELARRAGDDLISVADAKRGGLDWAMSADTARRMPNFSHGTAGVGHFLTELARATGAERFLAAARSAGVYLAAIAAPAGVEGALVFHHVPEGEELFYLGWCHGPAGTARFLLALERATGEPEWGALADRLVAGLAASGIPGARPPGFWNNVGQCCGNAGVAQFLLARSRLAPVEGHVALARSLTEDLLARGTRDAAGLRWTHAEHRVRPELRTTQTGLMQGAAGVGLFLLWAAAYDRGAPPNIVFPDDPLPGLAREAHDVRVRDLGVVIGELPTGPRNAITDVAPVAVGHATIDDRGDARTGVTVVIPRFGENTYLRKVPAAVYTGNGYGKATGFTQVEELGELEAPIALTNTLSVGTVLQAMVVRCLRMPGNEGVRSINVVVGETNDGWLNDIRAFHVKASHVDAAWDAAARGPVAEGCVGAGTGTLCLGYKGGIGTSSRVAGGYTVGVLVQSNFGGTLRVDGKAPGPPKKEEREEDGSCMVIVATDAPLDARNLRRLAKRALLGLGRVGSVMANGSGDYVVAFSTFDGNVIAAEAREPRTVTVLPNARMTPLFQAVVEATEEAVLNSLVAARTTTGRAGHTARAIEHERLRPR